MDRESDPILPHDIMRDLIRYYWNARMLAFTCHSLAEHWTALDPTRFILTHNSEIVNNDMKDYHNTQLSRSVLPNGVPHRRTYLSRGYYQASIMYHLGSVAQVCITGDGIFKSEPCADEPRIMIMTAIVTPEVDPYRYILTAETAETIFTLFARSEMEVDQDIWPRQKNISVIITRRGHGTSSLPSEHRYIVGPIFNINQPGTWAKSVVSMLIREPAETNLVQAKVNISPLGDGAFYYLDPSATTYLPGIRFQ